MAAIASPLEERALELPGDDDSSATKPAALPSPTPAAARPPRRRAPLVAGVLALAIGMVATGFYVRGRGHETTDDAQVEGHVATVQARVSGQVKRVLVQDNETVRAGDVLVELDDTDYRVRVTAAQADLRAAQAQLLVAEKQRGVAASSADSGLVVARGGITQAAATTTSARAQLEQARADAVAAESRQGLARTEVERARRLFDQGAISQAELDQRKSTFDQADSALALARARVASAEASIDNATGSIEAARGRLLAAQSAPAQIAAADAQVELARARVDQAQAALQQAELALGYTKVRAQVGGAVSRRSVEVGQLVSPERPLLAVVPLDDTWIVANFKEDQVARMRPGQLVRVKIDAYSGRELVGHVDSLAAGTGSRFALLPPDNASGNFTKVVQRVPVLVRLDERGDVTLRPGMSADVSVEVR